MTAVIIYMYPGVSFAKMSGFNINVRVTGLWNVGTIG